MRACLGCSMANYVFSLMFAYCEMGEQVTNSFGEIENTLAQMGTGIYSQSEYNEWCRCFWWLLSNQCNSWAMAIWSHSIQYETGYTNLESSNGDIIFQSESFPFQILNAGFSYFLIFREFLWGYYAAPRDGFCQGMFRKYLNCWLSKFIYLHH